MMDLGRAEPRVAPAVERTCGMCGGHGVVAMGLDPYWPCDACEGTGVVAHTGETNEF